MPVSELPLERRFAPLIGHDPLMRRIRRVLLIVAAILVACSVTGRVMGWDVPRGIGRRVFFSGILMASLAWWTLADEAVRAMLWRRRWMPVVRGGLVLFMLVFCVPFVGMVLLGRIPSMDTWPIFFTSLFQLWHMTLFVTVPIAVVVGYAIWWGWALIRGAGSARKPAAMEPASSVAPSTTQTGMLASIAAPSRREFLKAAGLMTPVITTAALGARYGMQSGKFAINKYDLPAPWLPQRLRGLTITQISDLHLGRLYRPRMLPRLVDGANSLKSDIVVVTGDIVDVSNDMLPAAIGAFAQLEARRGLYICLGNHDWIDSRDELVDALDDMRWNLLLDRRMHVGIDGERITLMGLDWGNSDVTRWGGGHRQRAERALAGYDRERDGPVIALAHHPHAFDALCDHGVPLTLSGHTHGGQLMLVPQRSDGQGDAGRDIGVGGLMFRYLRGFYHRGGNSLFVNSGVGNWFPIRWNAPAEIVQIRLV